MISPQTFLSFLACSRADVTRQQQLCCRFDHLIAGFSGTAGAGGAECRAHTHIALARPLLLSRGVMHCMTRLESTGIAWQLRSMK
jgi:hypothetical protein